MSTTARRLELGRVGESVRRVSARLQHKAPRTELSGRRFESSQQGPTDALATLIRLDVHALDFGSRLVEEPDGPTADGPAIVACHKERPTAVLEMLCLEVRPKALLRRIELGQASVQRRDQSLRI